FSGYISEKLFDCFFARCIPIYSGAPDVAQYVPPAAFIDAREFRSFAELERFLRGMTEADARRYIDAAHTFLASAAYESFRADRRRRDDPSLEALRALVGDSDTIVDIGAGGGRLALPPALVTRQVIAIDPSEGMLSVLREGMAEHHITNIDVLGGRWPEVS